MRILIKDLVPYLGTVSERARRVVELYHGLNGHEYHTLGEIAREMGVSRQRCHQIKNNAIAKMARAWIQAEER